MKKTLIAVALGCCAGIVQADQGPKWDQISISHISSDFEDESFKGFGISGTKLLGQNLLLAGSYSSTSTGDRYVVGTSGDDVELNQLSLGLGFRRALSSRADFFGIASYEEIEFKTTRWGSNVSASGDGYGLTAGLRSMINDRAELSAALSHISDGDDSDNYLILGGRFFFFDYFSADLGYSASSDIDTTTLSASFYF